MTPFGALIRYYRETRGLTQSDLAQRSAMDNKSISVIETGRRRPPNGDDLQRLFSALNLSNEERRELEVAAASSSYTIRISKEIAPIDLQLIHKLVKSVGCLAPTQKSAILEVIDQRHCI